MRLRDLQTAARVYGRRWFGSRDGRTVLDVGSGHRPHKDATHLVDLFPEDNTERGKPIKRHGRPLVAGTLEALPFKDQTFDFVYACHVLEHVRDPATACRELMRVGRSGYIETPSPFCEQGYNFPDPFKRGWSFHRWFVFLDSEQTLIFEPKNPETIDTFCDCRFSHFVKSIYSKAPDLNLIGKTLPRDCNTTTLHWTGRFDFQVRTHPRVMPAAFPAP